MCTASRSRKASVRRSPRAIAAQDADSGFQLRNRIARAGPAGGRSRSPAGSGRAAGCRRGRRGRSPGAGRSCARSRPSAEAPRLSVCAPGATPQRMPQVGTSLCPVRQSPRRPRPPAAPATPARPRLSASRGAGTAGVRRGRRATGDRGRRPRRRRAGGGGRAAGQPGGAWRPGRAGGGQGGQVGRAEHGQGHGRVADRAERSPIWSTPPVQAQARVVTTERTKAVGTAARCTKRLRRGRRLTMSQYCD